MTHPSRPNPAFDVGVDGIGWIVFDDPQRELNILTRPVMEELARCLVEARALGESGELKAVVLWSGKGSTFLAGADVGDIEEITDPAQGEMGCRLGQEIFQHLEDLPLPSLAAIHGVCLGGGVELALACTRRIASDAEETRLGFPELLLGILPAWGGTTRLPRLIGLREASKMILSGRRYSARQALAAGLLDEVLPAQGFKTLALEYAHGMATGPFSTEARRHRTPSLPDRSAFGRRIVLGLARRQVMARTRGHYPGPEKVLDVLGSILGSTPFGGSGHGGPGRRRSHRISGVQEPHPPLSPPGRCPKGERDSRRGPGLASTAKDEPTSEWQRGGDGASDFGRLPERGADPQEGGLSENGESMPSPVRFGIGEWTFWSHEVSQPSRKRSRDPPERQTDPEIRDRLIFSMVMEATSILEEGGVSRAGHIDLALIMGAGFPPFRGGLLRYIDHLGLSVLVARLRDFAHRYGARFDPPPLLLELARAGRTLYTRFP